MGEVNFDGIVGPTHNYSGLSYGNIASVHHKDTPSNPKEAALQGLEKMRFLHDLGVKQAVLPPHERPYLPVLRSLGFSGSETDILERVAHEMPELLIACSSAAPMWAANAATVTPSIDAVDRKLHFTPANLSSKFHRSIEWPTTSHVLKQIFPDACHHEALPEGSYFSDEGAANHTRFCEHHGEAGVHLFVYGRYSMKSQAVQPLKFPARQTFEASQAIIRRHQLHPEQVIIAQQSPRAVDAGVFHNDVISVGHRNLFLYHESAFVNTDTVIEAIRRKVAAVCHTDVILIKVPEARVSLEDAVASYLFNSQIITLRNDTMALIAPSECQEIAPVHDFIEEVIQDPTNPITEVYYLPLHQSMQNGGGPACLRLRIVLTDAERQTANPNVFFTEGLYSNLKVWIQKHYRDRLTPQDLADPYLLKETRKALEELKSILRL